MLSVLLCLIGIPQPTLHLADLLRVPQEMAVRALKQTGSRNIEAALEYISKMGYLDPRNELIVRVIKQTSPGNLNKSRLAMMY